MYDGIKEVINLLKYYEYNWILSIDLKTASFLLGEQKGFTKYPCDLCVRDSRDREKYWTQKEGPIRKTLETSIPNIVHDPIISRENIVFSPTPHKTRLDEAVCEGTG